MSKPSPAAQANLEKLLHEERRKSALTLTYIRVSFTILGTVLFLLLDTSDPFIDVSRYGTYVYAAIALVLFGAVKRFPRFQSLSAYAIAFVDVPLLSVIHHLQLEPLDATGKRWLNVPANIAMMCGMITLAAMSLNRAVVFLTALFAFASMMLMLYRCDFYLINALLVGIVPYAIAAGSMSLVSRIRRLVHESRQRDLLGKYILGERLGAGGMAEVFEATYSPEGGFERRVAVKKILPSWANDETAVALFRREAEVGAMLNHPNVVHVIDFGFDGTTYFIAMEYIDGCSLGQLLKDAKNARQPLELIEVTYIAWCLASALGEIHQLQTPTGAPMHLVHRDLNPPNVMISRAGEVKLADFGIAREVNSPTLTAVGVIRGKVSYSAPEQLLGKPFDGRSDLFALGLTLHELLTGDRLLAGDTEAEVARACLEAQFQPPSANRPEVPPELDAIVMGLLDRDPTRRTQSGQALLQQLSSLGAPTLDIHRGKARLSQRSQTVKSTGVANLGASMELASGLEATMSLTPVTDQTRELSAPSKDTQR